MGYVFRKESQDRKGGLGAKGGNLGNLNVLRDASRRANEDCAQLLPRVAHNDLRRDYSGEPLAADIRENLRPSIKDHLPPLWRDAAAVACGFGLVFVPEDGGG